MEKTVYTALGLMSGTSLDGVDVAVIETDGIDIFGFGPTAERQFADVERAALTSVTQDALDWRFNGPAPNSFVHGEDIIDRAHIDAIGQLSADIIGYHGQTILHHPPVDAVKGQTLQLGRGQVLADRLGLLVAYDFRTADVAAGGQGAPLAPIYHEALVRYSKLEGRVAVLNLGGVANVTAIVDGKLAWATDCGPANGPLDSWMQRNGAGDYDARGAASFAGLVNHVFIKQWLERYFFKRPIPRSADRYDFDVLDEMKDVSLEDGAATLASFCAQAVARDVQVFAADKVIVCGGGRKNPAVMAMLDMHIEADILSAEDVGWDGDMLEAQAFAYLAVRTLKGLPISFPETTGAPRPLTGGRIAYPEDSVIAVVKGTRNSEPLILNWSEVEAIISSGSIDDVGTLNAVTFRLKNLEDDAPDDLDIETLRAKFIPIYQSFILEALEAAPQEQIESKRY